MEITEVRIKLIEGSQDRLLGFCSITLDRAFVVRDLKIIRGSKGAFVAMPSRKLTDRCPRCSSKNELRAAFCSQCGVSLGEDRSFKLSDGRARLYADIAHPINSECRDAIQTRVMQAFDEERILALQPGYISRYDDFGEEGGDIDEHETWEAEHLTAPSARKDFQRRWDPPADGGQSPHPRSTSAPQEDFGFGVM